MSLDMHVYADLKDASILITGGIGTAQMEGILNYESRIALIDSHCEKGMM